MNNVLYYNSRLVNQINATILDFIPNINKSEICVLIENYSYSSQSDTLIQLVENTMEVKHYVLTTICHTENFYCIPAPRVKLYVGKGKQFNEVLSPISDIIDSYWILRYFLVLNRLD